MILSAGPEMLKAWAVWMSRLGEQWDEWGEDSLYLDRPGVNGEVQVFRGFRRRVGAARVARRRLFPGRHELSEPEREVLWGVDMTKAGWPARAAAVGAAPGAPAPEPPATGEESPSQP